RIQVEHPVTEMVTGTDLVREQFRIAAGHPLSFKQGDIRLKGHAIECRINAESPLRGFIPSPGLLTRWEPPSGDGIRIDSHCFPGYFVPPFYDSLLAKIITTGRDRSEAIGRMKGALDRFFVEGLETNIPFHSMIMTRADYLRGNINTRWVENLLAEEQTEDENHSIC
ncbi:MAG: acetyl-CoA carboxylase biotin carboxylase subunit, partial [bacterium]